MKNRRSNANRLSKAAALVLAIAAVTGCTLLSTATFYGGMYRAHRAGVRFRRTYEHLQADVPFSSRSDVTLDLYGQPDGSGYPVLIFVHGGGWNSYDKELFTPVAMQRLPQKMVVVIPDYTLYPDATCQQMAREVADAAAWVLGNISAYGGDPTRVYLSDPRRPAGVADPWRCGRDGTDRGESTHERGASRRSGAGDPRYRTDCPAVGAGSRRLSS